MGGRVGDRSPASADATPTATPQRRRTSMCIRNRKVTLVCTVANLAPGTQYRDPAGETWLMTDLPQTTDSRDLQHDVPEGPMSTVVNLSTGHVTQVRSDIRLGYDRKGRLYAARRLNK